MPNDFLAPCRIEDLELLYQTNPRWCSGRNTLLSQGVSLTRQFSPDRIDCDGNYKVHTLRTCCRVCNVMTGAQDAEVVRFAALTGNMHLYHEQVDIEQHVEYLRILWKSDLNMDRWKRRRSGEEEPPSRMAKSSVSVEAVRELLHRCRDKDGRYRSAYIPQELCFCTVRHCPLRPSIDRVMSVQNNGHRADHSAENVQIVCVFVNRLKGTSDEGDFIDMLQDFAQESDGRSAP